MNPNENLIDETEVPFPDAEGRAGTPLPAAQRDDTTSPDGENDNDYDAASLTGDAAHTASATAIAATRQAAKDGSHEDNAAAHSLATKMHQQATAAMSACGRHDEAAHHAALALAHDNQKYRALHNATDS